MAPAAAGFPRCGTALCPLGDRFEMRPAAISEAAVALLQVQWGLAAVRAVFCQGRSSDGALNVSVRTACVGRLRDILWTVGT